MDKNEIIANAIDRRAKLLENLVDPRRDIDHECGFPKNISDEQVDNFYKRNGVAKKIVNLWPSHSWKVSPEVTSVKEEGSEEVESEFDKAFKELHSQLRQNDLPDDDDQVYFKMDEGSPIWEILKQADTKSGIGTQGYSVIVLGFDDDGDLSDPLEKGSGGTLLYAETYSSLNAKINNLEEDSSNKRYGLPKSYNVDFRSATNVDTTATREVHWSRVIHVTNSPSRLFCDSRLEATYNIVHGSEKLIGAAPEGYFRMAFTKLLLESNPGTTIDDFDLDKLDENVDKFQNSMRGVLNLFGMTGKSVSPEVKDPDKIFDMLIDIICIAEDVPKRIFIGSERGELASSQDKQEWNERVEERQRRHLSPNVVSKLVTRLIWAGVLPPPDLGYEIEWPPLSNLDKEKSSEVALKRIQAMAAYIQSGVDSTLMTPFDFLTIEMGLSDDNARKVLANIEEYLTSLPEPEEDDEDN